MTSGRSVPTGSGLVAAALAAHRARATLTPCDATSRATSSGRRTLERGALVTALVLLFARSVTDAEERLGGQLLADLLESDPGSRERLRDRVRRHSASLDGLVACWLGFTRVGARLVARVRGPWPWRVLVAVALCVVAGRLATLPFAVGHLRHLGSGDGRVAYRHRGGDGLDRL